MSTEKNITSIVEKSYDLKPKELFMNELKWKYLVRSVLRGKNILLLGPTGQGKTLAVQCLVDALSETIVEEMTEEQLNSLKCEQNITILKTEIIE
jgi:type IV secretory pathway ATPase VirB11/archaellum biosynthesis ATPase